MFLIPSAINGFAAMAVKNMAELIKFACEPTSIKNTPILFGFISALEFKELDNEVTIGAIMPPPRAVFEGTTGARINSVRQIEYARPRGEFPKIRIKNKAILFPRFDLSCSDRVASGTLRRWLPGCLRSRCRLYT